MTEMLRSVTDFCVIFVRCSEVDKSVGNCIFMEHIYYITVFKVSGFSVFADIIQLLEFFTVSV